LLSDLKATSKEGRQIFFFLSAKHLPHFGVEGSNKKKKKKEIEQSNSQLWHWEINGGG